MRISGEQIAIPLKDGLNMNDAVFQACDNLHQLDLIEGGKTLHETIAALHYLQEWRNDMNEEVGSINLRFSPMQVQATRVMRDIWEKRHKQYEGGSDQFYSR